MSVNIAGEGGCPPFSLTDTPQLGRCRCRVRSAWPETLTRTTECKVRAYALVFLNLLEVGVSEKKSLRNRSTAKKG